jgi:TPR repeat protein
MAHRLSSTSSSQGKETYLVPIEYVHLMEKCANAVCRVVSSTGINGTGFLIGRQLIITCHHVLPNEDSCEHVPLTSSTPAKGIAQFFFEGARTPVNVPLDGKSLFLTSQSPGKQSAHDELLDFTVVALRTIEENDELKKIYTLPLSIFQNVVKPNGKEGEEAVIIQHPNGTEKKVSWGPTKVIATDGSAVHYNTPTFGGSSGSPVLSEKRQLFAIHRLGNCPQHSRCNQGVLISAIVEVLKKLKNPKNIKKTGFETIQEWIENKKASKQDIARYNRDEARKLAAIANGYFQPGHKPSISRMSAFNCLSQALEYLSKATEQYSADSPERAEIEKEINYLKFKKMEVMLDLQLSIFLPDEEDFKDLNTIKDLLKECNDQAIRQWFVFEKDEMGQKPELLKNPVRCFLMAFVAEELLEDVRESARWYLELVNSYHEQRDNVFLMNDCLSKANQICPSIAEDARFKLMNEIIQKRIKLVQDRFAEALTEIRDLAPKYQPTCFLLYDKKRETKRWLHKVYSELAELGVQPLYDEKIGRTHSDRPSMVALSNQVLNSERVLVIYTPAYARQYKEVLDAKIPVVLNAKARKKSIPDSMEFFDIECSGLVSRSSEDFKDGTIIGVFQDGDEKESVPTYLPQPKERFRLNSTRNYYPEALKLYAKVKGVDGDQRIDQYFVVLHAMQASPNKLHRLAKSGDKDAQFCCAWGQAHEMGGNLGFGHHLDEAKEWYQKAAAQGDDRAEFHLGNFYSKPIDERKSHYLKAVEKGNLRALNELIWIYDVAILRWVNTPPSEGEQQYIKPLLEEKEKFQRLIEKKQKPRAPLTDEQKSDNMEQVAFQISLSLAHEGDLKAMKRVYNCYKNGIGVQKNPQEAKNWEELRTLKKSNLPAFQEKQLDLVS